MTLFSDNVSMFADAMPRKRIRGVTGILDDNGQVNPDPTDGLDVGYCWVRLQGERTAIAVLNVSVTTQRANVPVILEEMDGGQYQIISIDPEDALYTYGIFAPALNMPDRIPEQDKSSIPHKRIKDLRLRLSSSGGLVLYVDAGVYQKLNGDLVYWGGGTIDVTASVPAVVDTKRIILIGITTSTNTLTQSAATAVATSATPITEPYFTVTDMTAARNAATSGVVWLWAFALFYGDTVISNTDRFVDLRQIVYEEGTLAIAQGGTGAITQTAAFDALAPNTVKGDIIAYNGSDNVRLPVGTTNGMQLIVDSTAATGLVWTAIGNTFQTTIATSDATVTNLISYTIAELVVVTIEGHYVASKTDKTFAAGGAFRASFRRQTGGNVSLVGSAWIEQSTDSVGVPVISIDVDTGAQTARIRWQGVIGENWIVKAQYRAIAY